MSSISFKGVTDTANNVITESIEWFKKPQVRSSTTFTDGKDGSTVTEHGYVPLIITAVIGLKSTASVDAVIAWLSGSGVLTFSEDPGKYRNARILNEINYEKLVRYKKAKVEFYISDPYRYVLSEATVTKTSFPATYTNAGTVASLPSISITGSGTVVIVFNGVTMTYVFDTGYTTVDCLSKEAYYGTTLKNRNLTLAAGTNGERLFPYLSVGSNTISIASGTVTQIDITPRTRYL